MRASLWRRRGFTTYRQTGGLIYSCYINQYLLVKRLLECLSECNIYSRCIQMHTVYMALCRDTVRQTGKSAINPLLQTHIVLNLHCCKLTGQVLLRLHNQPTGTSSPAPLLPSLRRVQPQAYIVRRGIPVQYTLQKTFSRELIRFKESFPKWRGKVCT